MGNLSQSANSSVYNRGSSILCDDYGKENADRAYCWMCMLKKSQWNQPIHPTGEDMHWTLAKLEEHRLLVSQDPTDKLGCKEKALVDCIECIRYAWPELHTLSGSWKSPVGKL